LHIGESRGGDNPVMPHHDLGRGLAPPQAAEGIVIKGRWIMEISRFSLTSLAIILKI